MRLKHDRGKSACLELRGCCHPCYSRSDDSHVIHSRPPDPLGSLAGELLPE